MLLSVIAPTYNEAENIPNLIEEVRQTMQKADIDFEFIVVDDGSTDGSDKILRSLAPIHPFLKVVVLRKNSGQSAAFDAGIQHASGSVIATLDADLQNDPADIPRLLKTLNEGYDVVTGWRKSRKDGLFFRRFPSKIANAIIRVVTGTRIHDLGCSLKVYRSTLLKELRLYGEMHRYICPLLENMGARIAEVEVNHRARAAGVSKYGIGRIFKVLLDMIYVWFNRTYQTKPMYVFGGTGVALVLTSIFLSALAGWEKYYHGAYVHRNPVFLIAMVCLIIAFQFFGIGLVAELLIRTYFEARGSNSYFIRETIGFLPPVQKKDSGINYYHDLPEMRR